MQLGMRLGMQLRLCKKRNVLKGYAFGYALLTLLEADK